MRASLLAVILAVAACHPTPAPPTPTPPDASQTQVVHDELVAAHCLADDDSGDGLASIAELAAGDAEPSWLSCLYRGGSVSTCATPCGD